MNTEGHMRLVYAFAAACAVAAGCGSSKATEASGTAGTTGAAGTSGTAGTTGTAGSGESQSVLERNKHASRDGAFVQAGLTKTAAATMAPDTGFAATFTGNMWASPLYLQNGPGGKGVYFAVTTNNDVFALDETSGAQVWTHNLGSSPTANGGSPTCGNIHPLGILSTPAIDATGRTIYVAGAIGTN
jgi:hypothetical protein